VAEAKGAQKRGAGLKRRRIGKREQLRQTDLMIGIGGSCGQPQMRAKITSEVASSLSEERHQAENLTV